MERPAVESPDTQEETTVRSVRAQGRHGGAPGMLASLFWGGRKWGPVRAKSGRPGKAGLWGFECGPGLGPVSLSPGGAYGAGHGEGCVLGTCVCAEKGETRGAPGEGRA